MCVCVSLHRGQEGFCEDAREHMRARGELTYLSTEFPQCNIVAAVAIEPDKNID